MMMNLGVVLLVKGPSECLKDNILCLSCDLRLK